jgi:hypothetical protein
MIFKGPFAALLLILVPLGLEAQSSVPPVDSSSNSVTMPTSYRNEPPRPFGDGQRSSLNYSSPSGFRNFFLIDFSQESSYNDNVVGGTQSNRGDGTFLFGPDIWLQRDGKHSEFALHYQPDFLLYARTPGYNTLQQRGQFDGNFEATPHLSFRGRASAFYLSGISQPSTNTEVMSSLGPPSSLNETVFTPLAREHGYGTRLDTTYQFSARASLSIFGGSSAIYFDKQASTDTALLDTQVQNAGVIYSYRLSRYDTVGLTYLLSYYEFGSNARALVHNPYFSYARQFSPNLSARIYGGPAYIRSNNELNTATGIPVVQITGFRNQWNWTVGGDLSVHSQNTAFQVGAQRQVSDGGGLLTTVISSEVTGSLRHKLSKRLDAVWNGSYARNSALLSGPAGGLVQDEIAGFSIEDSIHENLALRWGYTFTHQSGSGAATVFGTLNRNIVYFKVMYRLVRIPLGR